MSTSKYNPARPAGREHIPLYPKGFIALRIVQVALAVIIIALAAYGVSQVAFDGDTFIMVVALFTLIAGVYHLVSEFGSPNLYNYWAVLGLDVFLLIMWLASFALLASQVSVIFSYVNAYSFYYVSATDTAFASCLAAASGLGGLEFALFIASLSIHSVMLHRHRLAGLHCTPGTPATEPKLPTQPQQQQFYAPPQQQQQQQQPVAGSYAPYTPSSGTPQPGYAMATTPPPPQPTAAAYPPQQHQVVDPAASQPIPYQPGNSQ